MSPRQPQPVVVPSGVTLRDLSIALGQPMPDLIRALMAIGVMRTASQSLTDDEVQAMAAAFDREISIVKTEI